MNVSVPYATYSPSEGALMVRNLTANSRAGAASANLGAVDWGGLVTTLATSVVGYKVADLQNRRVAANARLQAALDAQAMQAAPALPAITQQPARRFAIVPLAIAGVAVLAAGFLLLKKRGK